MPPNLDKSDIGPVIASGVQQMLHLMESEILRLQEELDALRSSDHPRRRTLIRDRVKRIDERQVALDGLKASLNERVSGVNAKDP